MALKRSDTPDLDGTLVSFLSSFEPGFVNIKKKEKMVSSTCLAFVSQHELSLNFIIWNSGIPPFGGGWSGLKNKANAHSHMGLPWWLSGKESSCNARNTGLIPGLGGSLEEGMATPVFLPGESHGQRTLMGSSPQNHKEPDWSG